MFAFWSVKYSCFCSTFLSYADVIYMNRSSTLDALENKEVDLILMDTFSLASLQPILKKKSLKVTAMLDTNSGYGVVLGGLSTALTSDIKSEILARDTEFSEFIASIKPTLPVRYFRIIIFSCVCACARPCACALVRVRTLVRVRVRMCMRVRLRVFMFLYACACACVCGCACVYPSACAYRQMVYR